MLEIQPHSFLNKRRSHYWWSEAVINPPTFLLPSALRHFCFPEKITALLWAAVGCCGLWAVHTTPVGSVLKHLQRLKNSSHFAVLVISGSTGKAEYEKLLKQGMILLVKLARLEFKNSSCQHPPKAAKVHGTRLIPAKD